MKLNLGTKPTTSDEDIVLLYYKKQLIFYGEMCEFLETDMSDIAEKARLVEILLSEDLNAKYKLPSCLDEDDTGEDLFDELEWDNASKGYAGKGALSKFALFVLDLNVITHSSVISPLAHKSIDERTRGYLYN